MLKKVLLTGGTGFIGSHVAEALVERGVDVVFLKRSTSDLARVRTFADRLRIHDVDRTDLEGVFAQERPEAVFHLATYYRKTHTPADVEPMFAANLGFAGRLLESARAHGVGLFVNTGTFFELANRPLPVAEEAVPNPFNLYASTKIAFEELLRRFAAKHGIRSVTLKIFTPYGPRDSEAKLIPTLIRRALRDEEMALSQGLQKLDFIYVKDIARAYVLCLERADALAPGHEALNIGSGFPSSLRDVVSVLEELLGRPIRKRWGVPSAADFDITFADRSRARERLGWEPTTDLFQGLGEILAEERRRLG